MFCSKLIDKIKHYPLLEDIADYWGVYGGYKALIKSPFLWSAVLLTCLCHDQIQGEHNWAETARSVLPNILGFSIGAMAILLAFPSTKTFSVFRENGRKDSYYMTLSATLCHFIILQSLSLLMSVVEQSMNNIYFNSIGLFLFMYSLTTSFSVCFLLYSVARDYNSDNT